MPAPTAPLLDWQADVQRPSRGGSWLEHAVLGLSSLAVSYQRPRSGQLGPSFLCGGFSRALNRPVWTSTAYDVALYVSIPGGHSLLWHACVCGTICGPRPPTPDYYLCLSLPSVTYIAFLPGRANRRTRCQGKSRKDFGLTHAELRSYKTLIVVQAS